MWFLYARAQQPSPKAPVSRLKKSGDKAAKKAAPKRSPKEPKPGKGGAEKRAKKRPRPDQGGQGGQGAGPQGGEGAAGGGQDAYDSGEEVVATAADDAFIDSDDELGDIKAEYDAEKQVCVRFRLSQHSESVLAFTRAHAAHVKHTRSAAMPTHRFARFAK